MLRTSGCALIFIFVAACGDDRGGGDRADASVDSGHQDASDVDACLDEGCNVCGISEGRWENPLPTGDDLRHSHAFAAGGAVAGGGRSVYLLEGTRWMRLPEPPGDVVRHVGGSAANDVWVSDGNLVFRWDGSNWNALADPSVGVSLFYSNGEDETWIASFSQAAKWNPTSQQWERADTQASFVDVLTGFAPNDAWIGASNGQLSRFDGEQWILQAVPTTEDIIAIEGTGASDLWVITDRSTVLHRSGETWETVEVPFAGQRSYGFERFSDGRIITRTGSTTFQRFDGNGWLEPVAVPELASATLRVLADDRLIAVGTRDARAIGDFATLAFDFEDDRNQRLLIAFASGEDEWALSSDEESSRALRRSDGAWQEAGIFSHPAQALAVASGHAFVAGTRGKIQVWNGEAWQLHDTGTTDPFFFVWANGPNDAYALSAKNFASWNGERWQTSGLAGLTLEGASRLEDGTLVAFANEKLYVRRGTSLVPWFSLPAPVRAVGGVAEDDFWVSTNDTLYHRKENHLIEVEEPCGPTQAFIEANAANDVWFGATSRVVHWDGKTFRRRAGLPATVSALFVTTDRVLVGASREGVFSVAKEFESPACTPQCPSETCGGYDGCGGLCEDQCEGTEVCSVERTTCCEPRSCEERNRSCGTWHSTCDALLDCGSCEDGQLCDNGQCACAPACDGKFCGIDDNCGVRCGTCALGSACEDSQCEAHGQFVAYSLDEGRISPYKIKALSDGGYVLAGVRAGVSTFGDGEANETVLDANAGAFVARYGSDHTLSWATPLNGSSPTFFSDIVVDEDTQALYAAGSLDAKDVLAAKMSLTTGTLVWTLRTESANARAYALAQRADQSLVVVGDFQGSLTFQPETPEEVSVTSAGGNDIFIATVSPAGVVTELQRWGGSSHDFAMTVERSGSDLWVAGYVTGSSNLGGITVPSNGNELFVARADDSGAARWIARSPGPANISSVLERRPGLAVRADGTAVVAYSHAQSGSLVSADGETVAVATGGALIAQLSGAGQFAWHRTLGGNVRFHGARWTSDSKIVAAGSTTGGGIYGAGEEGEFQYLGNHRALPFLALYRNDGSFAWMQVPSERDGTFSDDYGWDVAIAPNASLLLAGEITGSRLIFGKDQNDETRFVYEGEARIPTFAVVARVLP